LKILKKYLNENLKREYIQHFINPTKTPILFILKNDGILRLYINYRNFNKITIKNRHPLPLVREILDRFSGQQSTRSSISKKPIIESASRKETNRKRPSEQDTATLNIR
jgi:hypothetical protein